MNSCTACLTPHCILKIKGLSQICVCSKCIVKPTCIEKCKDFVTFYRAHGMFALDKKTGKNNFYIESEKPKKNGIIKIKMKGKKVKTK